MAEVSGPAEYLVDAWCHIDVAHCSILLSCSSDTVGINMFMPITMHCFLHGQIDQDVANA